MSTEKELLRLDEVIEFTGIKKTLIYDLMKKERFPPSHPMRDAPSRVVWRKSEVIEWCNSQVA